MLEQEMASIIKYVLDKAGGPAPYYWNVPQNFSVPAAYFPTPEIDTGGETFLTYYMDYVWFIKLFHKTGQGAYSLGFDVMTAIRAARNLIPLIAEDGSEIAGSWVRINDPQLKVLDDGAAPKYAVGKLQENCRQLFGVSTSTFAGATYGMTGKYTVEEMRAHIEAWKKREVK